MWTNIFIHKDISKLIIQVSQHLSMKIFPEWAPSSLVLSQFKKVDNILLLLALLKLILFIFLQQQQFPTNRSNNSRWESSTQWWELSPPFSLLIDGLRTKLDGLHTLIVLIVQNFVLNGKAEIYLKKAWPYRRFKNINKMVWFWSADDLRHNILDRNIFD